MYCNISDILFRILRSFRIFDFTSEKQVFLIDKIAFKLKPKTKLVY